MRLCHCSVHGLTTARPDINILTVYMSVDESTTTIMNGTKINSILDIGGGDIQLYNKALLEKKLFWSREPFTTRKGHVQRVLPTSIIYGDKGLELWASITNLPSYYQTRGEAALFVENSGGLERWIQKDSVLIDLGCGYVSRRDE